MKKRKKLYFAVLMALFTMALGMNAMAATKVVTMKPNKLYTVNRTSYDDLTYHKFKVSKPGYITVYGYSYSMYSNNKYSLRVQLYNSRKKPLEQYATSMSEYSKPAYKTFYAVKQGTYYLGVKDKNYKLKYSFTPVKDRSGASQAKAVNVNRNKKGIGLLIAGEKGTKTDWFKIRLTRKQKVTFTFTARANDHLRLQIVPADPKLFIWGSSIYAKSTTEKVSTKDAFPAGTYYIKISRMLTGDKDTSGYYSFSWR